jgi:hypothetical protein
MRNDDERRKAIMAAAVTFSLSDLPQNAYTIQPTPSTSSASPVNVSSKSAAIINLGETPIQEKHTDQDQALDGTQQYAAKQLNALLDKQIEFVDGLWEHLESQRGKSTSPDKPTKSKKKKSTSNADSD